MLLLINMENNHIFTMLSSSIGCTLFELCVNGSTESVTLSRLIELASLIVLFPGVC